VVQGKEGNAIVLCQLNKRSQQQQTQPTIIDHHSSNQSNCLEFTDTTTFTWGRGKGD